MNHYHSRVFRALEGAKESIKSKVQQKRKRSNSLEHNNDKLWKKKIMTSGKKNNDK